MVTEAAVTVVVVDVDLISVDLSFFIFLAYYIVYEKMTHSHANAKRQVSGNPRVMVDHACDCSVV